MANFPPQPVPCFRRDGGGGRVAGLYRRRACGAALRCRKPEAARRALSQLKAELIARGEASDLFAREREDGLAAILGNLAQSVFGAPAYPSIESKAAHLLYFIVKNHPFADGNKRSGAFLFVDFLHQNRRLFRADGRAVINDTGLAALTLLVAESAPAQKDTLIRLLMHMLQHQPNL